MRSKNLTTENYCYTSPLTKRKLDNKEDTSPIASLLEFASMCEER